MFKFRTGYMDRGREIKKNNIKKKIEIVGNSEYILLWQNGMRRMED